MVIENYGIAKEQKIVNGRKATGAVLRWPDGEKVFCVARSLTSKLGIKHSAGLDFGKRVVFEPGPVFAAVIDGEYGRIVRSVTVKVCA